MVRLTPEELLKFVRVFSVSDPAFRVWTLTFGENKSKQVGEGIEFKEFRPYEPGEDIVNLDIDASLQEGEPTVRENLSEEKVRYAVILDDSCSLRSYGMRDAALLSLGCFLASAVKGKDSAQAIFIRGESYFFVSPKLYSVDDVMALLLELHRLPVVRDRTPSTLHTCSSISSRTISLANTRVLFMSDFFFEDVRAVYDRRIRAMILEGRDVLWRAVGSTYAGGVASTELRFLGISPDWGMFENLRSHIHYQDSEDSSVGVTHFTRK